MKRAQSTQPCPGWGPVAMGRGSVGLDAPGALRWGCAGQREPSSGRAVPPDVAIFAWIRGKLKLILGVQEISGV